jgi:hypothetical protein
MVLPAVAWKQKRQEKTEVLCRTPEETAPGRWGLYTYEWEASYVQETPARGSHMLKNASIERLISRSRGVGMVPGEISHETG